jgi:hypothetical protein
MAVFSESEKKLLLDAAKSQSEIHTYLMGVDGQPGFCKRIEKGLADITNRHNALEKRFWWLVGILLGSGLITGGAIGLESLLN